MTRTRTLRTALLTPAALVAALSAAHRPVSANPTTPAASVSRQAALDNIARTVLLPAYSDLAAKASGLAAATNAFTSTPSVASLKRTQQAWKDTLLAWRPTQAFWHRPSADLGVYGRIQFWPSRRQSIDRVLRATRPIDDQYLQELGANAVGLSALEVLLFDVREDDNARVAALSGRDGERLRVYYRALAQELVRKTRLVEDAWQGPRGYAAKFSSGGQKQLNLLVNDLLAAIETGVQGRLRTAIDRRTQPLFASELVEGGLSGTSLEGMATLLASTRTTFAGSTGAGIDDYLKTLNPASARRVDTQFQKTIDAVRAIGVPLEQAVETRQKAVELAHNECRALELLLKVEVTSTLGVTLTFKSTDGD